MTVLLQDYCRVPFPVKAVQVTEENMQELAEWCGGEILSATRTLRQKGTDNVARVESNYVKVDIHHPLNERQTKAFVGDWILQSSSGFKVYTERAFSHAFEKAAKHSDHDALEALKDAVDKPVTAKLGSKKVKITEISETFSDGRERFPEGSTIYTDADAQAQLEDVDVHEGALA